jgi:hypothetical protein
MTTEYLTFEEHKKQISGLKSYEIPGLKPYQINFLKKMEAYNLKIRQASDQERIKRKREYANLIVNSFYINNGNKYMKRAINKETGMPPFYDWFRENKNILL